MTILNLFKSKNEAFLGKGVSEKEIKEAEKELELSFSDDYREYLLCVGLAMCDGHELTGIGNASRNNVVDVTKQMKSFHEGIPDDWYVLENENIDYSVVWQDSKGNIYFNKKKKYSSLREFISDI